MNKKNSSSPTFKEESKLWKQGIQYVIGVDEVGRGAFAGPVTVGAVIFPKNFSASFLKEINDSKKLSPDNRNKLSPLIKSSLIYCISTTSVRVINKVGIGKATQMAFRKSITTIMNKVLKDNENPKFFLLVDGFHIKYVKKIGLKNQMAIIKGDCLSYSIAAASVIAKVHRDNLMIKISKTFPNYGFHIHKGYGTNMHREKIRRYGLSKVHRLSFNLTKYT